MALFICDYCGLEFKEYPANRPKPLKFCTMACQTAWQRESKVNTGANNPRWNDSRVPKSCEVCGQSFTVDATQNRRFAVRFCSRKCKATWQKQLSGSRSPSWRNANPERPCDNCGKVFKPKSGKPRQHYFCSRTCKGQWMSSNLVGARAPRWTGGKAEYYGPDWIRQSRAARKRDGYTCQHCGTPKGQSHKALDVHHIRPFRSFGYIAGVNTHHIAANDLANLITLCPACHKLAESSSSNNSSSSVILRARSSSPLASGSSSD
jgi:hypothetical protein